MPDDSAFLKQLSEQPDDLATLLVYADWLDDNGAADRAEFLRVQQRVQQRDVDALTFAVLRARVESGKDSRCHEERRHDVDERHGHPHRRAEAGG